MVIQPGERVCLVGRNGSGKSSLMKLVAGEYRPDGGELRRRPGLVLAQLPQDVPAGLHGPVFDVVAQGVGELGELLREYHRLSQALAAGETDDKTLARLERVQHQLEAQQGWELTSRVDAVLSRLELDPEADFDSLSGGMKRRVLLGQALVRQPDLLLLDEPTNHLDLPAIEWLEGFLREYQGALLFVTHDRRFLQRVATRIVELDRGRLSSWPGDYRAYLDGKQAQLDAEARQQANFDKKLAQEEAWIRQGIKARRTRNEGRVRALKAMREELRQRREQEGRAEFGVGEAERSGRLVAQAEHLSFGYEGRPLIRDFSATILRGDKIGVIGPNGSGKTTFIRLLLGELAPDSGQLKLGSRLEVAYFDQLRSQLDPEASVLDNVAGGSEQVTVNGQSKHVISYLQDFLFSPERARQPAKSLSGGERNRLLLAKLLTRPANVLVLDEPTNDLDVETLELLESLLLEFQGTVIVVSHDRSFLNNVAGRIFALEGNGRVGDYVGGFDDWLRQRPAPRATGKPPATPRPKASAPPRPPVQEASRSRKLSYKEQRELEQLPAQLEELEARLEELREALADPALYRDQADRVPALTAELERTEQRLETAFSRWEELEAASS
ncbi:ATP-binding cassette domain-containing protein [Alkalilimnicola sp. S0819]|nr:ATP-binding cassette domain-containing protein [Alkalilimnicola sp. S0819]MPQ16822.1 ATP-binding cassette domain-containing protein [Alkalilimnicola sp. S0819]